MPHYLDETKFKNWELEKEYDVFLFGNTSKKFYPLRSRLVSILQKMHNEKKIKFLYWDNTNMWKYTSKICDDNLSKADITVGFVDKDTMIDMFTKGVNPTSLVMSGKMTFNGDMSKGRSIKGLFMK